MILTACTLSRQLSACLNMHAAFATLHRRSTEPTINFDEYYLSKFIDIMLTTPGIKSTALQDYLQLLLGSIIWPFCPFVKTNAPASAGVPASIASSGQMRSTLEDGQGLPACWAFLTKYSRSADEDPSDLNCGGHGLCRGSDPRYAVVHETPFLSSIINAIPQLQSIVRIPIVTSLVQRRFIDI